MVTFTTESAQRVLPSGETFGSLEEFIRKYVVVSNDQALTLALWIAHTHGFEASIATPYLAVTSPVKRSGKSRVLEALDLVVRDPLFTSSISPAALYSIVADQKPTLLLDEVDSGGISEQLRGVLNSGHRRGGSVTRLRSIRGIRVAVKYPTFCPKIFASIGQALPSTVADRSIQIRLERRTAEEHVERFRRRDAEYEAEPIKDQLALFADRRVVEALADARPEIPAELNDRQADSWEPLLAIADMVGWGNAAREAAIRLSETDEEQDEGVQILGDIRDVFADARVDRIATASLLSGLQRLEDPVFEGDYRRMTGQALALKLRPFRIRPKTFRVAAETMKGYELSAFRDAWNRYVV